MSTTDSRIGEPYAEMRSLLEECRRERQELIAEVGPIAAPHLDPVAYVRRQVAEATVVQIDAALERILDGTYGLCRHCAKPIPAARLDILPYSDACVQCQDSVATGR
jgi:hypothetical protein